MFWTVDHPILGPATLCDRCALNAINEIAGSRDFGQFDGVSDALVIIDALCAIYGEPPFEMVGSEFGECGNCETRVSA